MEKGGRGLIYFLCLIYLFIGVSIVSDRFMSAIEVITSQEREISVRRRSRRSKRRMRIRKKKRRRNKQDGVVGVNDRQDGGEGGGCDDDEDDEDDRQIVVVRVWNETVANLTLMALGSSAPEILLSVIEIIAKDFQAGDLGPGTSIIFIL